MLPAAFIKGQDKQRLQRLLAVLFIALAAPTTALIWQAFDQLKWEAWYEYRGQAENLTRRIDAAVSSQIATAEARSFNDFAYINSVAPGKFVERSPLAAFPVAEDLPGVIGYFQVDPDGSFTTPLLPANDEDPGDYGIESTELEGRLSLANEIQRILADNQLARKEAATRGEILDNVGRRLAVGESVVPSPAVSAPEELDANDFGTQSSAYSFSTDANGSAEEQPVNQTEIAFEQKAFDELNQPARNKARQNKGVDTTDSDLQSGLRSSSSNYGRVQDLKLDEALDKKSARQNREILESEAEREDRFEAKFTRSRRVEESIVPQSEPAAAFRDDDRLDDKPMTITTFESEIDPYEFSLLDSGHLVLFRTVWRDSNRYIQGLLIEESVFSQVVIESAFRSTPLSEMSDLIVGYQDNVINVISGRTYNRSPLTAGNLVGSLLYRSKLSSPLESLELIFSINRLPPGPGATVLAWTSIVIALVFIGGFVALYRLGLGQIRLARQQQDFVSAISHELKTPLTSIRMYGEMLKEGWAEDEKRQQYYEYIHDESERLTRLITNVLQLAKITHNDPQVDIKPTTVRILMDQIKSKISNQAERAGFKLSFDVSDAVIDKQIDVDDDCFAQIVINLVDNGIKFSKDSKNKAIDITCVSTNADKISFCVRDYGPGIPKDQLRKIFKLFYRTESELTRETVGTGIGLAIVHQLTAAMNGKVDVLNKDTGVEFRVTFPAFKH